MAGLLGGEPVGQITKTPVTKHLSRFTVLLCVAPGLPVLISFGGVWGLRLNVSGSG